MEREILKWLLTGRVGCSSRAMAFCLSDIEDCDEKPTDFPRDVDDFYRCLLFLEAVPSARNHMDKLRAISSTWNRLIDKWDVIESTFLDETTKTYKLIKECIHS